jgi:hypothetical protein
VRRLFAGVLFAIAVLAAAQPAAATPVTEGAPRVTEEDLTRAMAERFRAALPGQAVRIAGQLQLEISRPGSDEPTQVNLDRVWNVCRAGTDQDCEASAAHFVTALQESFSEHPPVVRGQLRIMVRTVDYCAETSRMFRERRQETPLTRAGPADLCTLLVADYPNTMRVLRPDELPPLGLSAEEAWALAARQTLDNLPDPPTLVFEEGGYAIVTGREYTPTIILDEAGWRALAAAQGEILMAVPEDGVVVVARTAEVDPPGLRDAIRRAAAGAERPISSNLYRWTGRGWEVVPE